MKSIVMLVCSFAILSSGMLTAYPVQAQEIITDKKVTQINDNHHGEVVITGKAGETAYYTFYEDGYLKIYGSGKISPTYKSVDGKIRQTFGETVKEQAIEVEIGNGITEIEEKTFSDWKVKKVKIADSVTCIGDTAFYGTGVEEITLPKGIEKIPTAAFMWCSHLKKIVIPEGVKEIGDRAFYGSHLEEISLPESLERIGNSVFVGTYLNQIDLPQNLQYIGDEAFYACEEMETITLPQKIQEIGRWAFASVKLKELRMMGDAPKGVTNMTFEMCQEDMIIYVPENAIGYDVEPWTNFQIVYEKTEPEYAAGDVNQDGKINMKDARTVLKAAVGSEALNDEQKKLGDVDEDGKVGMKDARLILKYAVGSIAEF